MLRKILLCALISATPVLELRAALPAGLAFGLPAVPLYILCVVCNMLPVPFIILFMRRLLEWMKTKNKLDKIAFWIEKKGEKKLSVYKKYELFGLFVIVAVPIPGTGAWTGALVASLLGMRLKYAVPTIFCGVALAGFIMLLVSLGVIHIVA